MANFINRLQLYLKNFELFSVQPSISVISSDSVNLDEEEWQALLYNLDKWYIHKIFLWDDFSRYQTLYKALDENASKERKPFSVIFPFLPDLQQYILDNREKVNNFILGHYFSTRQYYKNQDSLGLDIFRFYGTDPEIILVQIRRKSGRVEITDPESVALIYQYSALREQPGPFKEISENLNIKSGILKVTGAANSQHNIIVIRKCHLYYDNRLKLNFNYLNKNHFSELQKKHVLAINEITSHLGGFIFNLEDMLNQKRPCSSVNISEEFNRFAREKYNLNTLETKACAWTSDRAKSNTEDIFLSVLLKKYFTENFKTAIIPQAGNAHIYSDISNPMLPLSPDGTEYTYRVNEELFYQDTPYFTDVMIKLRYALCNALKKDRAGVNVIIHDLLNTRYSFAEKKYHIDHLFLNGANSICFKVNGIPAENNASFYSQLNDADPNYPGYLQWFAYVHQLGHFLNSGVNRADVLVLFPELDDNYYRLQELVPELRRGGIAYEIIDFDLFNSKSCKCEQRYINFKDKLFNIIVLPGISVIPLVVMKKLDRFFRAGGILIAINNLPGQTPQPDEQKKLNKLKNKLWIEEPEASSGMYKQNNAGGMGYFIPNIKIFSQVLDDLYPHMRVQIKSADPGINYALKETNEAYHLFLLNTNETASISFQVISDYVGRPYLWNFNNGESEPHADWQINKNKLYINLHLRARESRMFIIDKMKSVKIWQLIENQLDVIDTINQNHSSFHITGWKRDIGKYNLLAGKNKEQELLNFEILKKLPVLAIKSEDWLMESAQHKGTISLGDLSVKFPFYSSAVFYHKVVIIDKTYLNNTSLFLDLGKLKHWCMVYINKKFIGQALAPPWRFDITDHVTEGDNEISIKIINNLSNYLAKDNKAGTLDFPVQEYGLWGPVRLIPFTKISLKI